MIALLKRLCIGVHTTQLRVILQPTFLKRSFRTQLEVELKLLGKRKLFERNTCQVLRVMRH
jgi:hypothetical protein